jgi:ABC-type glutathione transport system ATPase component
VGGTSGDCKIGKRMMIFAVSFRMLTRQAEYPDFRKRFQRPFFQIARIMETPVPRIPPVETAGLTFRYGKRTVVDSLDMALTEIEILGFVDPDGAGKTTGIRRLLGLLPPSSGTLWVFGRGSDVTGRQFSGGDTSRT